MAFLIGGLICTLGEVILNIFTHYGAEKEAAGAWASIILVFLSALFTGLGLYEKLAKHAGAGTLVPITGFANAVVSSAIESKSEGLILGVGAKIFHHCRTRYIVRYNGIGNLRNYLLFLYQVSLKPA